MTTSREMRSARVDRAVMRRANLALILEHLQRSGTATRSQIAADTGLSKATLSNLAVELIDRGLVREGAPDRDGAVGRPGLALALDGSRVAGIGMEISTDYAAVTAVDLRGSVVRQREIPFDAHALGTEATLDKLARLAATTVESLRESGFFVAGATIAAPGVIEYDSGTLRLAPNLGWSNLRIVEEIERRLDAAGRPPITLENDAKLAAVAEYDTVFRARGVDDLVYLAGQMGVGAGIIAHGELMRGWSGFSGEVGHLPLDPTGRPCACGRTGCWEGLVGLGALLRRSAEEQDPIRDTRRLLEDRLAELHDRALDGEARILEAIAGVAADLGRGLSIIVDVLNPEIVVLGGYFALLADLMLDDVRDAVAARRMAQGSIARVEASALGMTAASLGGAIAALDPVLRDPLMVPTLA